MKILTWIWSFTKEPLKNFVYNETFMLLAARFPIVPKWCIKAVLKWSLDKTINPIINEAYNEMGYKLDVLDGEIKVKRINNAQTVNDWNNAIDSLMQSSNNKRAH